MTTDERQPLLDKSKTKPCPVTGRSGDAPGHEFVAPREGDVRSVCPAINTMANHGYIPRDGKNITPYKIYSGLRTCYGLSIPLAIVLTAGGWFLIKRYFGQAITLFDLGLHGAVEHDASVVHADAPPLPAGTKKGAKQYGSVEIHPELVEDFIGTIRERASREAAYGASEFVSSETPLVAEDTVLVTGQDILQTRLRREKLSPPLDALHSEIARGEMAIILGVWEQRTPLAPAVGAIKPLAGVPLPWFRRWLAEERLPDGWKPERKQTLRDVMRRSKAIREEMKRIRDEQGEAAA